MIRGDVRWPVPGRRPIGSAWALWLCFGVLGCVGDVGSGGGGGDRIDAAGGGDPIDAAAGDWDASSDGGTDGGLAPVGVAVSGSLLDYQEAMAAVGGQLVGGDIDTDGISPPLSTTSGAAGAYSLLAVPVGSIFFAEVSVTNPSTYRPTRSRVIAVADQPVVVNVYAVSAPFVAQNYLAALPDNEPVAGTAVVIADLYNADGTPYVGAVAANVALTDSEGIAVVGAQGPFFFNASGYTDVNQAASIENPTGLARVGFLDVPAGNHQLRIVDGDVVVAARAVTAVAGGATLASVGGPAGGEVGTPTFATNIYPDLQRISAGGVGCASCHTAGGQNANLQFDVAAADVLTALQTRIDVMNPDASLLLTNPLYGSGEPHPNRTFPDVLDATYGKWWLWIDQGAAP